MLACTLFSQTIIQSFVLSNYLLNTQYITQTYCINKNKPQLHCNGKCHLKSQLSKTSNDEKSATPIITINSELYTNVSLIRFTFDKQIIFTTKQFSNFVLIPYTEQSIPVISPPPQA